MIGFDDIYDIDEIREFESLKYLFVSGGAYDIIKAIEYRYIQELNNAPLFNFGFGDYNIEEDRIDDQINSNNGDHYNVFHTVLSTVPKFFEYNPNAIMMVQGSDHNNEFTDNCRKDCRKNCTESCKNVNRRIKTYRYFVDKNYQELIKEYQFFGGTRVDDKIVLHLNYETGREYDVVFCKKIYNFVV